MPEYTKTPENLKYDNFVRDIAAVCNRYSIENNSDTPDFMLAEFMTGCLNVYENTLRARTEWMQPSHATQQPPEPPPIVNGDQEE